jgi:Mrp family chromosome partitioning ATPase
VMLVCADLEGSVIAGMVGLAQGPGLTEALAGQLTPDEVSQQPAGTPSLRVITPGTGAATADDFRQDAIDMFIGDLRDHARYIVVEAPAVVSGPDVYTLAHAADATVLVVEGRRTRSDDVIAAVRQLGRIGTAVLGTVLLPTPRPAAKKDPAPALASTQAERRALGQARTGDGPAVAIGGEASDDWSAGEKPASSLLKG